MVSPLAGELCSGALQAHKPIREKRVSGRPWVQKPPCVVGVAVPAAAGGQLLLCTKLWPDLHSELLDRFRLAPSV